MARPQAYATKAKISRALYQNLRLLGTDSRADAESGSYRLAGQWLWAAVAFRERGLLRRRYRHRPPVADSC
jgi:hypothetical protein